MYRILIVGAGFAGATIARLLAENGYKILLIDKRNHIGGNAYDYINSKSERIHKYGPHLFHCNNKDPSLKFLNRFTEWVEYKHKVRAILENGKTTPLPINRTTLEDVFNISLRTEKETINFISSLRLKKINPKNSDELFLASYGEKITYQEVIDQLKNRDRLDSTRKISPLIRSKDAILIDTSNLTIEQQIEKIISFIKS